LNRLEGGILILPLNWLYGTDRGRIAPGLIADLLLVKGNPTTNISDTLSILGVWRGGVGRSNH